MENYGEVSVLDFMRLMKDFLDRRISADQYARDYFGLSKKRINISDGAISRITQQAYGDADDYESDPAIRYPKWIGEPELRERVTKSLHELEALGYRLDQG